eukprot:g4210.t1
MWESRNRRREYRSFEHEASGADPAVTIFSDPALQQRIGITNRALGEPDSSAEVEIKGSTSEVRRGEADFEKLVETRPDDVITILRDHAVVKVGEFESNNPLLLRAFQDHRMFTYGFDSIEDPNFEATWKSILEHEGKSRIPRDTGWHETMLLVVYCVTVRHAANVLNDGILRPLLDKANTGESSDDMWDFPSVRAVIEYKWTHWARKYLVAEFILYLGWLLSFVGFMIIYIEKNIVQDFQERMGTDDQAFAVIAYFLDIMSLAFMIPFLVIEYNTIMFYKWKWLQMWNLFDSLAYFLQLIVSFMHFTHIKFSNNIFVSLLSIHCTILFIKVQYFARVMGPRASYVETLKTLIYNVRYFLLFIVLCTVSVALSFGALYKWENNGQDGLEDFSSLLKSVVTTYSVLLGNFETSYVFETDNRFIKGLYFLLFQLIMSITVLNLLIAVITESYSNTMKKENIMYNKGRAQIVDELELSLPAMFYPNFKPYVHFIVCEKPKRLEYELSALVSQRDSNGSEEIKHELRALKDMMLVMQKQMESIHDKIK